MLLVSIAAASSAAVQLAAIVAALKLIPVTGTRRPWAMIAAAQALIQAVCLFFCFRPEAGATRTVVPLAFTSLFSSVLMLGAMLNIGPVFRAQRDRKDELRRSRDILEAGVRERAAELANLNQALIIQMAEREKAEQALRKSEEHLSFIAEKTGDVLYRLRYDTMSYEYMSPSLALLTGYNPEEIGSTGFSKIVQRIDRVGEENLSRSEIAAIRTQGKTQEYRADYLIQTKSGERKWLADHSFPWFDDSSNLIGSVGILTDISERKRMEGALKESERQLRFLSSRLITVQEEERKKIAQELHDSVGQTLVAIKYGVETLAARTGGGGDGMAVLEGLIPTVQNAIEETRSIYMGLRPTMLDGMGVISTIGWYCREFMNSHKNLHVEFEKTIEEQEIPDSLKVGIFRVVQEAMSNVAKHSEAEWVTVSLGGTGGAVELTVEDNGVGFDIDSALLHMDSTRCLGLTGMKERVELAGGSFNIESSPGDGALVRARWPVGEILLKTN